MNENEVKKRAFAMPLHNPSYPVGPYRFIDREYLIITYETNIDILKELVPEPLEVTEPLVKFEFIRMPDSTGFGDYTESGQVIPVRYGKTEGGFTLSMYLDDHPPIAGGREIWGFPKKLANPKLFVEKEVLIGNLDYGSTRVANGTMGYKFQEIDPQKVQQSMSGANFLLKIIPDVGGNTRICELIEYHLQNITIKGAWTGPANLELFHHALAPVAALPVNSIVSALHFKSDLTLPYGRVVHDYMKS